MNNAQGRDRRGGWCYRVAPLVYELVFVCVVVGGLMTLPRPGYAAPGTVYLTFDDGPANTTRNILSVLDQAEVPATFFVVGEHIVLTPSRRETLRRLQSSPWARIGNHSFSHAHGNYHAFYADRDGMLQDFQKNNALLGFYTPPFPTRLPARMDWRFDEYYKGDTSFPTEDKKIIPTNINLLFEHGFVIYGWDVEWRQDDETQRLVAPHAMLMEIQTRFEDNISVKPGKIVVLMHDRYFRGAAGKETLWLFVHLLRQEGHTFDFMDNY